MKGLLVSTLALVATALCFAPAAPAQDKPQPLAIKPLAQKKVAELPPGALYWRIENFPSAADAQAAAGLRLRLREPVSVHVEEVVVRTAARPRLVVLGGKRLGVG